MPEDGIEAPDLPPTVLFTHVLVVNGENGPMLASVDNAANLFASEVSAGATDLDEVRLDFVEDRTLLLEANLPRDPPLTGAVGDCDKCTTPHVFRILGSAINKPPGVNSAGLLEVRVEGPRLIQTWYGTAQESSTDSQIFRRSSSNKDTLPVPVFDETVGFPGGWIPCSITDPEIDVRIAAQVGVLPAPGNDANLCRAHRNYQVTDTGFHRPPGTAHGIVEVKVEGNRVLQTWFGTAGESSGNSLIFRRSSNDAGVTWEELTAFPDDGWIPCSVTDPEIDARIATQVALLGLLPAPGNDANECKAYRNYLVTDSPVAGLHQPLGTTRGIIEVKVEGNRIVQTWFGTAGENSGNSEIFRRSSNDAGATWAESALGQFHPDGWIPCSVTDREITALVGSVTGTYQNPDLASSVPSPVVLRYSNVVMYHEYDQDPDPLLDNGPLVNTAIKEATARRRKLVFDPHFRIGIMTPVLWRPGMVWESYGAQFHKRAEFDDIAMFSQAADGISDVAAPNTRIGGFEVRGLTIINDFPDPVFGFGGDVMDWFANDAFLEDIFCKVSDQPFPHGHDKTNGRFMVWGGTRVRMNRITQIGGAGALQRSVSNPNASGIQAGGMYCNAALDCLVTNFHIELDDDCIINIPKSAGQWNGSSYPLPSDDRSDQNIRRVTYAHGRCSAWSGKIGTIAMQPNVGSRPAPGPAYEAWKRLWDAPQSAEIADVLYFDVKGLHANNSFKIANTRSKAGIRRITFRDCAATMFPLYNNETGLTEGNPNSVLIEAAHVDDENSTSSVIGAPGNYDHDAPVEDIRFENCTFRETYQNVVETATNGTNSPNRDYLEKLLPKRVWFIGGVWDRPVLPSPVVNFDGVDGGGIIGVTMHGRDVDMIQISDVPPTGFVNAEPVGGEGFLIKDNIIKRLGGGMIGVKLGSGLPVHNVQVIGNTFESLNANQSTVAVKLDSKPAPLSYCENCVVAMNNMVNFPAGFTGKKIVEGNETVGRVNHIYDNAGWERDTRKLVRYNTKTASYVIDEGDEHETIAMNVGTPNTVTVVQYNDLAPGAPDAEFPVGTLIRVLQIGAGQTTIVNGPAVTLVSPSGFFKIAGQYREAILENLALNVWRVTGDLVA